MLMRAHDFMLSKVLPLKVNQLNSNEKEENCHSCSDFHCIPVSSSLLNVMCSCLLCTRVCFTSRRSAFHCSAPSFNTCHFRHIYWESESFFAVFKDDILMFCVCVCVPSKWDFSTLLSFVIVLKFNVPLCVKISEFCLWRTFSNLILFSHRRLFFASYFLKGREIVFRLNRKISISLMDLSLFFAEIQLYFNSLSIKMSFKISP